MHASGVRTALVRNLGKKFWYALEHLTSALASPPPKSTRILAASHGVPDQSNHSLKLSAIFNSLNMATALQKQLATIAAASTHQLDLRAQKSAHGKSLLFDAKVAASQSFENLYLICHDGYRDLCALDARFLHFAKSLFSEQSKVEDRAQMTRDENTKLDAVLEAFITLVGPRILLRPAEKALEWLVRRFRIHEYNTECLVLTYLPYHNTPQFLALLSILSPQLPTALRFLFPYIQAPTNPPRRTIAYTAINTPAFFKAYQSYVARVVQAGHQAPHMLSFWSSITVEAIFGILNSSSTGRRDIQDQKTEELVLQVLPVLNSCMRAKFGAETVTACYTIVIILVNQAKVGDKMLDGLIEAVALAHDEASLNECLACLAVIAGERTTAQIPEQVHKRLLKIPQLCQKLHFVSKQCQVERLALGCALGALSGATRSEEKRTIFNDFLTSGLLSAPKSQIVFSALLQLLRDSEPGSNDHGELLGLATKLTESKQLLRVLQAAAKQHNVDLDGIGITIEQTFEIEDINDADSDDEMVDVEEANGAQQIELPTVSATSFLDAKSDAEFASVADAFEQAVTAKQTKRFLSSGALLQGDALQKSLYLSFLVRVWSSQRAIPVRLAALSATKTTIEQVDSAQLLQNLLPYLVYALTDPSPIIRRGAAACVGVLSGKLITKSKSRSWGSSDLYGKSSKSLVELSGDDVSTLLSSILKPILEECVMDSKFIIPALRDLLEGSQSSKTQSKPVLKAQLRTTVLSFLASHTDLSPLLSVRLGLLPTFNFLGKVSDTVRNNTILPLVRNWCSLITVEATLRCESESLSLEDADRVHISALQPKDVKSAQLLHEVISGSLNKDRIVLTNAAFDLVNSAWLAFRSEARTMLAQSILDLSFNESLEESDKLRRESALETLRNVKLDSATLLTFLENVPSAVQMPEGPPAKKRRRTSRSEMARVELSSQDDVQRLLRKLTLVLELIEGSNPGQHPALFRNLFSVFGELQPLKQQSGSELVYLQSMILGSLTPIVNTLKVYVLQKFDFQSLTICRIRQTQRNTSPQFAQICLLIASDTPPALKFRTARCY